ncbi:hypothetical protein RND81_01G091400 [Saponaria officinalis]
MSSYSRLGCGLRDLILQKDFLTEFRSVYDFLTYSDGKICHYIVTVCLGQGITVWQYHWEGDGLSDRYIGYKPLNDFLDMTHFESGYSKISFIEQGSYGQVLESVFKGESPFREMKFEGTDQVDGPLFFGLAVVVVMVLSACSVPGDVSAVMSGIHI